MDASAFVAALGPGLAPNSSTRERFERAWIESRSWRGEDDTVARGVARRLEQLGGHWEQWEALDLSGLILAEACTLGEPKAIAHFERNFVEGVRPAVGRVNPDPAFVDEVLQCLRTRCLLDTGKGTALSRYEGKGSLLTYVRVIAVREALMLRRGSVPPTSSEELDIEASLTSPEMGLLKRQFREAFAQAFRQSLAELEPEARNLLRHHYFHGLTFAQLADLYGQSRSAVGRRIEKARARLLTATRRRLAAVLSTTKEEFEQLMALVASQIELSLERHLA